MTQLVDSRVPALRRQGYLVLSWGATFPGPYMVGFDRTGRIPDVALLKTFEIYGPGTLRFYLQDRATMMPSSSGRP